ncbi:MAG: primosomal protein N' [Candidatus Aminicenantes bacterium]|nr:primosomal protein N' [Candidatus Aminicenantes bacterium]
MAYVEVILPLPLKKTFIYSVSEELNPAIKAGVRVLVPFRSRKLTGFVLKIEKEKPKEEFQIKPVLQILDENPILAPNFVDFIFKLSQTSLVAPGELLKAALPPSFWVEEKGGYKLVQKPKKDEIKEKFGQKTEAVEKVLNLWSGKKALSWSYLKKKLDFRGWPSLIQRLEALGWIRKETKIYFKRKRMEVISSAPAQLQLTFFSERNYQPHFDLIEKALEKKEFKYFLLIGSKSRREEFFLSLLKKRAQVSSKILILWPEIASLTCFLERLTNLLGPKRIACLHSDLPLRKRESDWVRIFQDEVDVVVGTRSAVFAPLPRIDLIYIEEEADEAYVHPSPAYDARLAAKLRAQQDKAVVLLASSAPAVSSFFHAKNQGLIIDLGHSPRKLNILVYSGENSKILSPELQGMIEARFLSREPVALLINRRGYASILVCLRCGQIALCPKCRRALTFYARKDKLVCPQCGFKDKRWLRCPECQSQVISPRGYGLEAVEEEINRLWPQARIRSFEAESFRGKKQLATFLKEFRSGQIDIVLGTQFLLSHLDWKKVSLAAVLHPEMMLAQPDFRAGEKVFSLVWRLQEEMEKNRQGEVIIQTACPENYVLQALAKADYLELVSTELRFRRLLNLPPYRSLIRIILTGRSRRELARQARELKKRLDEFQEIEEILGPVFLPTRKGKGEIQIWLKGKKKEEIIHFISLILNKMNLSPFLEIID